MLGPPNSGLDHNLSASIRLDQTPPDYTVLQIDTISSSSVVLYYETLPGNKPNNNHNMLLVAQGTRVPAGAGDVSLYPIELNDADGYQTISNLDIASGPYVLGYTVGPTSDTVAAAIVLYIDGKSSPPFSTTIGLVAANSNSVVLNYRTPYNYRPESYGNWVGLFRGGDAPFIRPGAPDRTVSVTGDAPEGELAFNGLTLVRGQPYTLVYYTGPNSTEAACALTFTILSSGQEDAPDADDCNCAIPAK
ncbi:MAG: hypothetical protein ACJ8CR_08655 [Roseiflexaceae bacterium]